MEKIIKDAAIIGAGPSGLSASIYLKRSNHSFAIFESEIAGGKLVQATTIDNYLGFHNKTGMELAMELINHVSELGIDITYETILDIKKENNRFILTSNQNQYEVKAIIIACGIINQKIGIINEDKYFGRGVSYCATCDGMFFKNKDVALIGEDDLAINEAIYLANIVKKLYVLSTNSSLNVNENLLETLSNFKNVEFIYNAKPKEIKGDEVVNSLTYLKDNKEHSINVNAIFPIGKEASSLSFIKSLNLEMDNIFIKVDNNMSTSVIGVFASGDIANRPLKQIITAASDGAIAATSAIKYIKGVNKNEKN